MKNKKIRLALALSGTKQWELAKLMDISEFTLCRKLREELPEEEQDQIVKLIEASSVSDGGESNEDRV